MASSSKLNYIKSYTLMSVQSEIGKARKKWWAEESTSRTVAGKLDETPSKKKKLHTSLLPPSKLSPPSFSTRAEYEYIVAKLTISVDQDVPTYDQVRVAAHETHPGVTLDHLTIKRIRDRLRYQRNVLRVAEVISSFSRMRPTEKQLTELLKRKDWYTKRTLGDIQKQWTPSDRRDTTNQHRVEEERKWIDCIASQKWNSCIIRLTDDPSIGKGIFAKEDIKSGQVVCDYHGDLISHSEGMKRYNS
ncbi:hypothetical protein CHS0354_016687 [Potamilus streckersoni]|uniref:SET domain-containing protein n=1 Tax=Potamilus streckersoni TaxID=2493646 RepID=A0AAE0WCQ7_9BIVA|nr:hypothetical protein CHS0354_016687 [Potamilus streckersoni]